MLAEINLVSIPSAMSGSRSFNLKLAEVIKFNAPQKKRNVETEIIEKLQLTVKEAHRRYNNVFTAFCIL